MEINETVRLRIVAVAPPIGVLFALQRGSKEIVSPTLSTGEDIVFDLFLTVRDNRMDGLPNFLGPFAQGPPATRFLYIASGMMAGQIDSFWTRRAKIPLSGLGWSLITRARETSNAVLEARFAATGRDGGPACASVPLLEGGWQISEVAPSEP